MSSPSTQLPVVKICMRGIPEIADTDWISITNGIAVLTGRNNVGKTRILQAIATLAPPTEHAGIPPQVRIEADGTTIEMVLGLGAVAERYDVTDAGSSHISARWVPSELNRGMWELHVNGDSQFGTPDKFAWFRTSLPMSDVVNASLSRLVYVPAQRTIPGTVPAERLEVPGPSGTDLGRAIFTQRNDATARFDELQAVMAGLFPEIAAILTRPTGAGQTIRITYRDRFARRDTPLDESGTGVAQALHLVALTLFSQPGRILLIDEPHAYLHPGAERRLVEFLRDHPEHSYVCATHSPVFISAADPEACYLVTRDEAGTAMRSVFAAGLTRRHIFAELGISAGDVALAEHIVFVEGPSDLAVYPMLFDRLGYNVSQQNCLVISLAGADLTRPLSVILTELSHQLQVPFTVLLDGDKRDQYSDNPAVCFLPARDLEEFLLQDPAAVSAGLLAALEQENSESADQVRAAWPQTAVEEYLATNRRAETKAPDLLKGLARQMGMTYSKAVHTPSIAKYLAGTVVDQLKPVVARLSAA